MIGRAVRSGLERHGFAVDWVLDGDSALRSVEEGLYGAAVLDLGLPKRDGMELLRSLRRSGNRIPVLIATARDAVASRIEGLDAGADDYVLKPFDLGELVARIRAVLRRHAGHGAAVLTRADLCLDPVGRCVTWKGVDVPVSAREFSILEALLLAGGRTMSRQQLEASIYDWGHEVGSNAIEVHVSHLRKKLGGGVITNVRGMGYRIA